MFFTGWQFEFRKGKNGGEKFWRSVAEQKAG